MSLKLSDYLLSDTVLFVLLPFLDTLTACQLCRASRDAAVSVQRVAYLSGKPITNAKLIEATSKYCREQISQGAPSIVSFPRAGGSVGVSCTLWLGLPVIGLATGEVVLLRHDLGNVTKASRAVKERVAMGKLTRWRAGEVGRSCTVLAHQHRLWSAVGHRIKLWKREKSVPVLVKTLHATCSQVIKLVDVDPFLYVLAPRGVERFEIYNGQLDTTFPRLDVGMEIAAGDLLCSSTGNNEGVRVLIASTTGQIFVATLRQQASQNEAAWELCLIPSDPLIAIDERAVKDLKWLNHDHGACLRRNSDVLILSTQTRCILQTIRSGIPAEGRFLHFQWGYIVVGNTSKRIQLLKRLRKKKASAHSEKDIETKWVLFRTIELQSPVCAGFAAPMPSTSHPVIVTTTFDGSINAITFTSAPTSITSRQIEAANKRQRIISRK